MPEQRTLIMWGALGVVLVVAIWMWVISPVMGYRARLAGNIDSGSRTLQSLTTLSAEYKTLAERAGRRSTPRQGTLFALLEETAAKENVRSNIEFMRPSARQAEGRRDELVEMRLAGVPLARFMAFLAAAEGAAATVHVERMNIKTNPNKPLDVDLLFSAPRNEPG